MGRQRNEKANIESVSDRESNSIPIMLSVNVQELERTNQVKARVNGTFTYGLVDSGASVSCVSRAFLQQHKTLARTPISKCKMPHVQGVGGNLVNITGKVDLEIEINQIIMAHTFLVLDKMQQSIIFGCDFLRENDITVNIAQGIIELRGIVAEPIGNQSKFFFAYAKRRTLVPPRCEALLPVHSKQAQNFSELLLEPLSRFQEDCMLVGSKMIAQVTEGNFMYQVINPTDGPQVVEVGQKLCICSPIETNSILTLLTPAKTDNTAPDETEQVMTYDTLETDPQYNEYIKTALNMGVNLENSSLTKEEKQTFLAFLGKNRDVFAMDLTELGRTHVHKHSIDTGDASPVRKRFYRQTPEMRAETSRQVQALLDANIIEKSMSQWQSPVVLCKKKCGNWRVAIDYRNLNAVTKFCSWPIPRLECIFDALGEAKASIFSCLDLKSGFWQIPLDRDSREKTGFVTHEGVYQFKMMPMGLVNAPSTFQAVMNEVLRGMTYRNAIVYIDDILLYDRDLTTHMQTLSEVFNRLRDADLKLQPTKCDWAAKEVRYLGHKISREGVSVDDSKIKVVRDFPTPQNVKHVRSFLGLCNYYRRHVKDYSKIVAPLTQLLRLDSKFSWSTECEHAFQTMKRKLTSAPILAFPDMNREFILYTDASQFAISYILGQKGDDGRERVVAYGGRGLRDSERAWPISQREGLALVEGVKYYHVYLANRKFTAVTDHKALEWMKDVKFTHTNGRLARWSILLQEYNMEIVYKKGVIHTNADSLSRRDGYPTPPEPPEFNNISVPHVTQVNTLSCQTPVTESDQLEVRTAHEQDRDELPDREDELTEYSIEVGEEIPPSIIEILAIDVHEALTQLEDDYYNIDPLELAKSILVASITDIKQLQREDEWYHDMIIYKESRKYPKDEQASKLVSAEKEEYLLDEGLLYHLWYPRGKGHKVDRLIKQLCIPQQLRDDILISYHDSVLGGHQGAERTYQKIRYKYFWPTLYEDVQYYCKSCIACQEGKRYIHGKRAPLHPIPPNDTFQKLHMDILELPETEQGYRYVLVLVDQFSKWPEAFPMKKIGAKEVAKILYNEILCRYGAFSSLVTDRAKNFMSKVMQELCKFFQITKTHTSAYHPSSNGLVEKANSSLISALRMLADKDQTNWPELLPSVMLAYRASPATQSTHMSPYFILYGRECRLPIDVALIPSSDTGTTVAQHITELLSNFETTREVVKENIIHAQSKYKKQYDKKAGANCYTAGDRVWLLVSRRSEGRCKKLGKLYTGPYYICVRYGDDTYTLRKCADNKLVAARVHNNRLKPFFDPLERPTNVPREFHNLEEEMNPEEMTDEQLEAALAEEIGPDTDLAVDDALGTKDAKMHIDTHQDQYRKLPTKHASQGQVHKNPPQVRAGKRSVNEPKSEDVSHEPRKSPPQNRAGRLSEDKPVSEDNPEGKKTSSHAQGDGPSTVCLDKKNDRDRLDNCSSPPDGAGTTTHNELPKQTKSETDVTEDDTNQWHAVEKLVESKRYKGIRWYKVKWVGESKRTWVPEYNISDNLIRDFHIRKTQARKRRKRRN